MEVQPAWVKFCVWFTAIVFAAALVGGCIALKYQADIHRAERVIEQYKAEHGIE